VKDSHARAISSALDRPIFVNYHQRSKIREVWAATHQGRDLPADVPDDAFRAFATNDTVHLFVDDSETYESALWLLMHELAHTGVTNSRLLTNAFRSWSKRDPDYLTSDEVHEADPEEQLANHVANRGMTNLGLPTDLDRLWWRRRRSRMGRAR
jgi:hypothetical protein